MNNIELRLMELQNLPEAHDMKDDLTVLYNAVLTNKPVMVLELGSGGGLSTRTFALASKKLDEGEGPHPPSTKIISVDIDADRQMKVFEKLKAEGLEEHVSFVLQDSVAFLQQNSQNICDFIFIDTDHTYKQTLAEILNAAPMLSKKGYLFLHDTRYPEVWAALQTFLRQNVSFMYVDYDTPAGLGLLIRKYQYWIPLNVEA